MLFQIIKSVGIAHHSYLLGAGGKVAVVDPRRDIDVYLKIAEKNGLKIVYIFETHRHEDFVIGSLELAEATGANIYHGHNLDFSYGNSAGEADKFKLGKIELEVLDTPGHTLESISLVLRDLNVSDDVQMVFTGDLIFAGETGRIDFYGREERAKMASLLYDSIFGKILPLGDQSIICPAHGAGSVCGADIREQDYTTIGYEKRTNPSLKFIKEREFVRHKVAEELYTPPYFSKMEYYNQMGAPLFCKLPNIPPVTSKKLKKMINGEVQILDVRKPTSFAGGHVPGSQNIWREGVPAFAGWFLNYEPPIIVVDEHGKPTDDVIRALVRLGYDNIYGFLSGGFPSWYMHAEEVGSLNLWTVQDLKKSQSNGGFYLLDVRKIDDRKKGYIDGSEHIYVGEVQRRIKEIPQDIPVVVYCDSGYKSTIAASVLKKNGYSNVTTVLGSMNAWQNAKYPVEKD